MCLCLCLSVAIWAQAMCDQRPRLKPIPSKARPLPRAPQPLPRAPRPVPLDRPLGPPPAPRAPRPLLRAPLGPRPLPPGPCGPYWAPGPCDPRLATPLQCALWRLAAAVAKADATPAAATAVAIPAARPLLVRKPPPPRPRRLLPQPLRVQAEAAEGDVRAAARPVRRVEEETAPHTPPLGPSPEEIAKRGQQDEEMAAKRHRTAFLAAVCEVHRHLRRPPPPPRPPPPASHEQS